MLYYIVKSIRYWFILCNGCHQRRFAVGNLYFILECFVIKCLNCYLLLQSYQISEHHNGFFAVKAKWKVWLHALTERGLYLWSLVSHLHAGTIQGPKWCSSQKRRSFKVTNFIPSIGNIHFLSEKTTYPTNQPFPCQDLYWGYCLQATHSDIQGQLWNITATGRNWLQTAV